MTQDTLQTVISDKPKRRTLWAVEVKGSDGTYINLVVATSKQKAKDLVKGLGHKQVTYVCETDSYNEDKLLMYW